jgi:hypothetical protein
MSDKIKDALSKLDPANDNHWTQDGLPRLDTIKILSGDPSLSREAVTAANPEFNRESAQAAASAAQAGGATTPAAPTEPTPPAPASTATGAETQPPAPPAPPESDLPVLNPPPVAVATGDQDELATKIAEAKLNLSDRQDALQLAKQELVDAQNEVAHLEAQLKESSPNNANTIMDYLQRQQKNLEERGARKQLIRESGLDLKQLAKDLKSPLDAAMERKNTRGAQRPVRS